MNAEAKKKKLTRPSAPVRLMHETRAFGDMIAANPHDQAPKLVLADYLEEQGHGAVAEALRRGTLAGTSGKHPQDWSMRGGAPQEWFGHRLVGGFTSDIGQLGRGVGVEVYSNTTPSREHKPATLYHNIHLSVQHTGGRHIVSFSTSDHSLVQRLLDELPPKPNTLEAGRSATHEAILRETGGSSSEQN